MTKAQFKATYKIRKVKDRFFILCLAYNEPVKRMTNNGARVYTFSNKAKAQAFLNGFISQRSNQYKTKGN